MTAIGRFFVLSVAVAGLTQALIALGAGGLGWNGVMSNVVAVVLGTLVLYLGARAWVWPAARGGRAVAAFWATALLGLAVSTAAAAVATRLFASAWSVNAANLGAYALLWAGRATVLHRLFAPPAPARAV